MLEALKKLSAYALIKTNVTDTPYSRKVMQHNPHIRERLEEKTRSAKMTNDKPSTKEIAKTFSTVTGQEITEEEVNLIQDIQLPDEVDEVTEGTVTPVMDQDEASLDCKYYPESYFIECACSELSAVYNIILGKETGTTFPIKVQDKEVNVLLDTGAEKSCMSTAMLMKLNLVLSNANKPRLHNASGRDMKTQGIVFVDFRLGNTNFKQEFVVCDDLVRPMILGCDFTVNQYIGVI